MRFTSVALGLLTLCAVSSPTRAESIATSDPAGPTPIAVGHPLEQHMTRASSVVLDLRRLPKTAPRKFERPEWEDPDVTPVELPGGPSVAPPTSAPARSAPAPSPSISFDGLDFATWGAGHPPDTNGDVGPNYFIQSVNTSIGVFDKSTGTRVAAFTFDTLMSQGHFGNLCDTDNFGDPVVLYDTFEDRWIITDFAFKLDSSGNVVNPPGAFQCFAVSKSGDPVTGGWNFYSISVAGGLNDYPKFGIWPDGLYMSANLFNYASGGAYKNPRLYALNKAQMYAGKSTVQIVSFDAPAAEFTLMPANARLQAGTPPPGSPNYFAVVWQYLNAVSVYKFHVDWAHVPASSLTGPFLSLTATNWSQFTGASGRAPSPANSLDTLYPRLMMQNQYSNIGGAESLWDSHTVGASGATSAQAAVRYYQVDVTAGTVQGTATQAFTWSPDATVHRFMPSVAVDKAGDMAIGYSGSSATLNPALRYAGRLAGDPINAITQTETSLFEGTGSQSGTCGSTCTRWGDYSTMTLDPDGCTFWYTNEYYATNGLNDLTRIGAFAFPSCVPNTTGGTLQGTVSKAGTPLVGAVVALGSRTTTTDSMGDYSFSPLPAGTYPTLSASFPGCTTGTVTSVVIADVSTTTQNFDLAAAPANGCLTDTTQADFQTGTPTNVDLNSSPGDITLSNVPSIDQQNTTLSNSGVGITTTTWGGQTFTAGLTGQLTRIDVNLFCSGCTGTTPDLTLSLRATSGNLPTGADIASATITGFNSGAGGFYTATFASPPTITAGTVYALVIRPVANPSPGVYALTRSATNVYSNGQRVSGATSGTVWSAPLTGGQTTDAGFITYVSTGYAASGDFISNVKDANPAAGYTPVWSTLSWTANVPANTSLLFQVAASNSVDGPFNYVGSDGTAATYFNNGDSLSQFNGNRYLQYRVYFSTGDSTITPTLNDVTVCFSDICITPPTPTITPDGPTTFCAGGSVSLLSSNASGNQWLLDGSPINGATNQSFSATTGGDYTLTFTAPSGCSSAVSAPVTVTVNPIPATPTITPSGPTTIYAGGSVTLTSSAASGNQWFLDGNPIGGATGAQFVATASGDYTVEVTSIGCSSSKSAPTTVTVLTIPDLAISNTDGTTTATPGGNTVYTVVASNPGPSDVTGVTVTDTFDTAFTCSWTCTGAGGGTCTASGSGNISDTISLPGNSSATYSVSCSIAAASTGTITSTATIAEPAGLTDPNTGNNTATDTDTLIGQADLALTMSDNRSMVEIGKSVNYIITVTNSAGPSTATGIVTDALPGGLTDGSWVCIPFGGAICANGTGNSLTDTATLPVGSQASYVYSATVVTGDMNDQLINAASVAMQGTDTVPGNNSATDTDLVVIFDDGFEGTPLTTPVTVGAGADTVTASLRVNATLLGQLSMVPKAVASGTSAGGKALFTLELAHFGQQYVGRIVTIDARGYENRSAWFNIDLQQHLLSFSWQTVAAQSGAYLSIGGNAPLTVRSGASSALTQLWVTLENGVPWLVLISN